MSTRSNFLMVQMAQNRSDMGSRLDRKKLHRSNIDVLLILLDCPCNVSKEKSIKSIGYYFNNIDIWSVFRVFIWL